jgi:hypothetical protein
VRIRFSSRWRYLVRCPQLIVGSTAYRRHLLARLLYLTYGLLAFLIIQTLRKSSQAKIAVAITVTGALASFALLQGLSPNGALLATRMGGWIWPLRQPQQRRADGDAGPNPAHLLPHPLPQGHMRTVIAAGAALMAGTILLAPAAA